MRNAALLFLAIALTGCDKPTATVAETSTTTPVAKEYTGPVIQNAIAKEAYELQERCANTSAAEFKEGGFKEGGTSDANGSDITSYQTHYNFRLNKCFQLITNQHIPKDKKEQPSKTVTLYELLEHKEVADYFEFGDWKNPRTKTTWDCNVDRQPMGCKTEDAFMDLIDHYLTE